MTKKLFRTLVSALAIASLTCGTVFAKDPDTVFLRAKILYESPDKNEMPLSEENFELADHWKKDGEYWYYTEPIQDGESVDFLKSVQIPHSWNSKSSGQTFNLVIYADVAENVNGTAAWGGLIDGESRRSRITKLDLILNEYELDEKGKRIPYENNKVVLPGDKIDKQVVLTVDFSVRKPSGGGGSSDDDWEPDPPKKVVYPVVPVKPSDPEPVIPDWSPLADTGDHSNTAIYLAAAVIALTSAGLFAFKAKKEQ